MLREVRLTELKHTVFGRAALNEPDLDHVAYLEALIQGGALLPPVQITPDDEIIDGRHRIQAYQNLAYETIPCEVVAGLTRLEYQALALTANTGGAKPPVKADIAFVVTQLQREGASVAEIFRLLCPKFPKRVIKQQLEWNQSNEKLTRFRAALKLRNDEDLTFAQVAERTGLPEAELKEFNRTGGKSRKRENKFLELRKSFQEPNKSYGEKAKHLRVRTFEAFKNEQLTEEQAIMLLKLPGDYGRNLVRQSDGAIQRLLAQAKAVRQVAG